jgi:hypothetical protein
MSLPPLSERNGRRAADPPALIAYPLGQQATGMAADIIPIWTRLCKLL